MKETVKIEFKKIHNLTFVFKTKIITLNEKITSLEINPTGIIYTQKEDYYFAPLSEDYDIEKIAEKFAKEEVYPHFEQ